MRPQSQPRLVRLWPSRSLLASRGSTKRTMSLLGCRTSTQKHSSQGGHGSVPFGYGSCMERFRWFRFSVPAVPLQTRLFCVSVQFNRKGRFRFRLRFRDDGSGSSGSEIRFREKRFRRFRFSVPVRFLSHPVKSRTDKHGAHETQNLTHELSHGNAPENAHGSVFRQEKGAQTQTFGSGR